jgi:hypothetical protein
MRAWAQARNIGAGTITCNYDGENKHKTDIGAGVFVGSNSDFGGAAYSQRRRLYRGRQHITENIEKDALAIGRARQVAKSGMAEKDSRAEQSPQKQERLNMCGIIGIAGTRDVAPLIVDALEAARISRL